MSGNIVIKLKCKSCFRLCRIKSLKRILIFKNSGGGDVAWCEFYPPERPLLVPYLRISLNERLRNTIGL
jgi:hypothetical protein